MKTCPCNLQRFFFSNIKLKISVNYFDIFNIFAQNIVWGYTLEPPRRGGSKEYPHFMFWNKNKKIGIPLHTPVFLYKSGVYMTRTCYPDELSACILF